MPSAVIGALRVDLNLGTAGWRTGLNDARRDAETAAGKFQIVGDRITKVGAGLTAGITAPLVGIGAAALKTAANFEGAMIKLGIATKATTGEMAQMKELALELGSSTVFSASEAAGAMEELAKNGVGVSDILGGAAKAAVDLAAAAGAELEPAAVAVSDAMNQFHLSAKDLPALVNQITGAVNESKLDFADFQLGMAQAGGVAGNVGVSFEDFNAVLAGTSSMFSSGSDAGTSLKTFLTTLVPKSKAAAAAMDEYGLKFYKANGQMKSMSEIAQMLQDKLAGLSDQKKTDVLTEIFGSDAMRTAIGLMQLGGKGLDDIAAKIKATDAAAQSADRMKGLNSQLEQLGGSLETLAIRIGDTGLLTTVTAAIGAVTDLVDKMTQISPEATQIAVGLAAAAAAVGPIMLVLGPVISGIGSLIGLFGGWQTAIAAAATEAGSFTALLAPFAPVVGTIAAALGVAYLAWQNWDQIAPILQGLWATFQETLGPPLLEIMTAVWEAVKQFGMALGELLVEAGYALGPAFLGIVKAMGAVIGATFRTVGEVLSAIISLFKGDFAAAGQHAWNAIKAALGGIGSAFVALGSGAVESIGRMVSGIASALIGELGATWDALKKKIDEARGWFFWLFDAVVGHSYIPDMVDGIAYEMDRLDKVMVQKVHDATAASGQSMKGLSEKAKEAAREHTKAAKATADAWKKLAGGLGPLLDRLFPDAAALRQLRDDMLLIEKGQKAGFLDGDQAAEARRRLMLGGDSDQARADVGKDLLATDLDLDPMAGELNKWEKKLPDLSKTAQDTAAKMVEAFAGMARDVVGSLRGMVSAFKGGDILGGLTSILDIVVQVAGLVRGNTTPRQAVTVTGGVGGVPYGGGRALGGPVVPGKRYRVGERGRGEWFEPGVPGRIVPDNSGPGGGNVYHISGNLLTPEFWQQIASMDDQAAIRGATGGAQLAQDQASYARTRFIG